MKVTVIRTSGVEELHDVPFNQIADLLGTTSIDTVNLRDGRVMLVDDFGWEVRSVNHGDGRFEMVPVRPLKPFNDKATSLYHAVCVPGTTHRIVGDVAIVEDRR